MRVTPGIYPATGCHVRDRTSPFESGHGQLSTDLLTHLGFKRMVSCRFRDKCMRLKGADMQNYFIGCS